MRAARGLVGWLLVSLAAGFVGSRFLPGAWYAALAKPSWTPPDGVFGPVWTALYVLMGVAAWLVWRRAGWARARGALGLYLAQLALNALWSFLFFGRHRMDLAFAEIILLWLVILATLIAFWRIRPAAGALLLPYLCWVGFASALNFAVWRLNARTGSPAGEAVAAASAPAASPLPVLSVAQAAALPATKPPVFFVCDGGDTLRVQPLGDWEAVALVLDGERVILPHAVSASGARYSDERRTFWNKGDTAFVEVDGVVAEQGCRLVRTEATAGLSGRSR